ncbi:pentapeptide repeat-containing protein [Herbaspirillum sp. ST 5-3]|uniref:pentapeptide repeat-containing protein n=1 Tax=Oxalobacteraceae TaxID=75682 RepID=UPI0010A34C1C|nr:pentapeptide repeat-containing protein [Herbaspirillum sp. ST 5-3]
MARPEHSKDDFRNQSKVGADFRKYKLYMARFEFSNFPNSDFSAVSAKQCCFIRANLAGSNFTGANLYGANFGGADLRGVNFKSAILHHVNFENALIEGANFIGASIKMCKKLKLSDEQVEQLEQAKKAQREVTSKDLEERKNSPEYQKKTIDLITKKPWVEKIEDERERGGSIVVTLKSGYEFLNMPGSSIQNFNTVESAQDGTTKKAVILSP